MNNDDDDDDDNDDLRLPAFPQSLLFAAHCEVLSFDSSESQLLPIQPVPVLFYCTKSHHINCCGDYIFPIINDNESVHVGMLK